MSWEIPEADTSAKSSMNTIFKNTREALNCDPILLVYLLNLLECHPTKLGRAVLWIWI